MPETPRLAVLNDPADTQRVDKWLWFVRIVKSRTQATALVTSGKVRLNRTKIEKPAHLVRAGDVLTISVGARVKVYEVVAAGEKRGSATLAQQLYRDLTPVTARPADKPPMTAVAGQREPGAGRPSKRDRRLTDRLRGDDKL